MNHSARFIIISVIVLLFGFYIFTVQKNIISPVVPTSGITVQLLTPISTK